MEPLRASARCPHLNVEGGDMALQVLLGLHLLIQLVLQAVPLIFQLTQFGGHIELLPGFFLKQLLQKRAHMVVPGMLPGSPRWCSTILTWVS